MTVPTAITRAAALSMLGLLLIPIVGRRRRFERWRRQGLDPIAEEQRIWARREARKRRIAAKIKGAFRR